MRKPDNEKIWNTETSDFTEGDRITFHNTHKGIETTYIVKRVKENGDIELVCYSVKKQQPPLQ
jgi:hypothetical protein